MSFSDIFKSSFLEQITSFSLLDMALALGLAFVIGLYIFIIYRKTFNGVMYSASFGLSLVALSMITALVILTISSNVVLSLGMVGALSIVRFRTAIKEPMDIAFLFWASAVGIVTGAGLFPLAIFGSLLIGLVLLVFANRKSGACPYLLVVNCANGQAEAAVCQAVVGQVKRQAVKSKSVSAGGVELTLEVRLQDAATEFVNEIAQLPGVSNAVLVSYNGEYMA